MKSLSESLFDDKLIDKDLSLFGEQYEPSSVKIYDDDRDMFQPEDYEAEDIKWLGSFVKLNVLKKNVKPYPANQIKAYKDYPALTELVCYFITLINKLPAPTKEMCNGFYGVINDKEIRKSIIEPYFKKSVITPGPGLQVTVCLRRGWNSDFVFVIASGKYKKDSSGKRGYRQKILEIKFKKK